MKLSKFEVEQLSLEEMEAIKAGSGTCQTGEMKSTSDTQDYETVPTPYKLD